MEKRPERFRSELNGTSNPDPCDAGAVLHQLNYQANWEQVVVWVEYKPVDVEIGATIKFIHSNPHFKCMENSGIIMYCSKLFELVQP